MSQEQRRTIRTVTTSRTTSSYGASGNRSTFGYWIPLALTVTAATVGLVAWIWSERTDEEESESEAEQAYATGNRPPYQSGGGLGGAAAAAGAAGLGAAAGYAGMSGGLPPGPGPAGTQPPPPPGGFAPGPPVQGGFQGPPPGPSPRPGGEAASYFRDDQSRAISTGVTTSQEDQGLVARMSNAVGLSLGNTPGRTNVSGGGWASRSLAAAGSMVGGAVNSIRSMADGDQQFSDQERWSEEADKPGRTMSPRKSAASVAAGAALGAATGAAIGARGLQRQGTAAEFYSGEVDAPRRSSVSRLKRKTVAVVVSSALKGSDGLDVDAHQSILAHLPEYLHSETTRIIVLIYAPDLHTHPLSLISRRAAEQQQYATSVRSQSTSSYAKINTPGANGTPLQTPGDFPMDSQNEESDDKGILAHVDPKPIDSSTSLSRQASKDERGTSTSLAQGSSVSQDRGRNSTIDLQSNPLDEEASSLFKTLYNQATALVDRDTSILSFSAQDGHKHILRSIQPEVVYIQESLCGTNGSIVSELQGWVRQIVIVIGDEGGTGGLVDSDEEESGMQKRTEEDGSKWWRKESVTGVGRGVSVVESLHIAEDWRRRVNDEE